MSHMRPAAGGESRKRDSFLSCALRRAPRGYKRRIDDVIPMNAENAWIWQVETNVNLKKVDVL